MELPLPLGEVALSFDEVKVSASIHWNAKRNKFIGRALSPDDMSSLHDVYQEIESNGRIKKKVHVGIDQEKAQSEKDSHSKNRGGKKPN